MARIDLKECDIFIEDGLAGTANVDDATISMGDTTLEIDDVVLNTAVTNQVPVGARFTVSGESGSPVHVVTERDPSSGATTEITFTPALGSGVLAADPGADEEQEIAAFSGPPDGGTFTLTFNLLGESPFTTDPIAYNADATTIQGEVDAAAATAMIAGYVAGDIDVAGGPLTTDPVTLTFSGTSVAKKNHALTTIDGSQLTNGTANGISEEEAGAPVISEPVITFLHQMLEIKVGDGDLTYSENYEYNYDLDRGELDTVRRGDEQPMEVNMNFTFEHITTGTDEPVSPTDAVRRRGGASEWVSSSGDLCEPYAVDVRVVRTPECGTADPDIWVFPDFRVENIEPSFRDATIAISGRCNAEEPIVSRSDS